MKFSERLGFRPPNTMLQLKNMDDALRIGLWNIFERFFLMEALHLRERGRQTSYFDGFFATLWEIYLKEPLDEIPRSVSKLRGKIKELHSVWEWFEVYDFAEFCCRYSKDKNGRTEHAKLVEAYNEVLERERSGYRLIASVLAPISTEVEQAEVNEALAMSKSVGLSGVTAHLKSALEKLSDRANPDYRNSIKESISAVEAVCRRLSGDEKATLGDALKMIDKIEIHPALKGAYSKLYGYTNDESGIRHAIIDESKSDFDDAKYMLVVCSAFVNYLISKAQKAGILKS